jgi:hypothetical protein
MSASYHERARLKVAVWEAPPLMELFRRLKRPLWVGDNK